MRIDKVKFTAHYDEFGFIKDQWVGFEGIIDDTEDPEKQATVLKEMTDRWYKANNPKSIENHASGLYQSIPEYKSSGTPTVIQVKSTEYKEVEETTVETIMACEDLKELDTYKILVKGKEELQQAFWYREEQLKQKSSSYESLDDNK